MAHYEQDISFHLMPKRFMVWDKASKRFLTKKMPGEVNKVFSIPELLPLIDCLTEIEKEKLVFCQSIDQLDIDGNEIFEGSIVEAGYDKVYGFVNKMPRHHSWYIEYADGKGDAYSLDCSRGFVRVISHILLNPELIKEKE